MEAILKRTAQRVHEFDDEKLLIEQAQNGDREAFEQLVRRHDRDILRLAFHMLGNREEAREVFQERSEEHTSELQSLAYLVCRLLLEKKKKTKNKTNTKLLYLTCGHTPN